VTGVGSSLPPKQSGVRRTFIQGTELKGTVSALLLDYGIMVDVGADYDALAYVDELDWYDVSEEIEVDMNVTVRTHSDMLVLGSHARVVLKIPALNRALCAAVRCYLNPPLHNGSLALAPRALLNWAPEIPYPRASFPRSQGHQVREEFEGRPFRFTLLTRYRGLPLVASPDVVGGHFSFTQRTATGMMNPCSLHNSALEFCYRRRVLPSLSFPPYRDPVRQLAPVSVRRFGVQIPVDGHI
jgi:hypothetical protein